MDLETFRGNLDDTYSTVLASDSRTQTRLVVQVVVSDGGSGHSTYFLVRGPRVNLKTQSLAEASRKYWEVCIQ